MAKAKYRLLLEVSPESDLFFKCGIRKKAKELTDADLKAIHDSGCPDVEKIDKPDKPQ